MQQDINIKVGKQSPQEYFSIIRNQIKTNQVSISGITTENELISNFESHCIPKEIETMTIDNYFDFLEKRRKLMALKIKNYYFSL